MTDQLSLEEVEEHLRPIGNVTVLEQDGSPPPAAGEGALESGAGEEGEEPASGTFTERPASGR